MKPIDYYHLKFVEILFIYQIKLIHPDGKVVNRIFYDFPIDEKGYELWELEFGGSKFNIQICITFTEPYKSKDLEIRISKTIARKTSLKWWFLYWLVMPLNSLFLLSFITIFTTIFFIVLFQKYRESLLFKAYIQMIKGEHLNDQNIHENLRTNEVENVKWQ